MMTISKQLLSKGDLCRIFGLYRGRKLDYQKLRAKIMTDTALEALGLTPEVYRKLRGEFDYELTCKVVDYFKLHPEESEQNAAAA